jgi:hypothetical protein
MTQGISKLTSVPARALPTRMQVPRPRSPWLKRQASAAARRSERFVFEQARVYLSQLKAIEGDWRHQSPNRGRRNARTGATKASREDARRLRAVMAVIGILGAGCQHQVFLALVGSEAGLDLSRRRVDADHLVEQHRGMWSLAHPALHQSPTAEDLTGSRCPLSS